MIDRARAMPGMSTRRPLQLFADQWAFRLTTYRRDGTPVSTAINVVVEGDHAFFRTFEESGKFKRLRRSPRVSVAPSTVTGEPTGPAIAAQARLLEGSEDQHAGQLIDAKHTLFQGILVRLGHRIRGYTTRHFELRPAS
jgi:PPOX class probable F420-dependent enzyme